jgi:hypothetical protein
VTVTTTLISYQFCVTNLIIQARPKAVVNIATPAILDYEPTEAAFEAFYCVIYSYGSWVCRCIRICLAIAVWASRVTYISAGLPLCGLLFVLLDLGIQAGHDALQAPEPLKQLCICRLPAFTRRATWTREYALYFCAHAVGAWLSLVAFDLQ